VFQAANAFANKTAIENVSGPLRLFGVNQEEAIERSTAALEAVGISQQANTRARRLSGGELQRLSIARALAARRRFIFADEPTGQLDETSTEEVMKTLIDSKPDDSVVVIVTHDPRVVQRCDQQFRLSADGLHRLQ